MVCLNFASAKNSDGDFPGGGQAQEECIASATGLPPCP
ncbi:PARG family protein [Fulvivirga ulvae]|nr:poly(ADP-ribose) glycohydrolase domain-containing protein [Fulvivirga ulvae]UII32090.1 PARG family protein [Fulvivirga ulvae]